MSPAAPRRATKTPQQKKRESLAKDRRNVYGENDKSSRKNIPRSKAGVNRANRRADTLAVLKATGRLDVERADDAELALTGRRRKRWRKSPDTPLGQVIAWQLRRRRRLDDSPGESD